MKQQGTDVTTEQVRAWVEQTLREQNEMGEVTQVRICSATADSGLFDAPSESVVAGLSQAEHDAWIEDAYGKPVADPTPEEERAAIDRMNEVEAKNLAKNPNYYGKPGSAAHINDQTWEVPTTLQVLRLIAANRSRPSVRLLDACYGPRAKPLRTQVLAVLLGHKVTGSDKEVQWGNFRKRMLALVGATGAGTGTIAAEDAEFEAKAEAILKGGAE